MPPPLTFTVEVEGGWRTTNDGDVMTLAIIDHTSGTQIMEIQAPESLVLDWLRNRIRGDKTARAKFWGVEQVGLERQVRMVAWSVAEASNAALLAARKALIKVVGGHGWQIEDSARFNFHRATRQPDGTYHYRMTLVRYVEPGLPVAPEVEALVAPD